VVKGGGEAKVSSREKRRAEGIPDFSGLAGCHGAGKGAIGEGVFFFFFPNYTLGHLDRAGEERGRVVGSREEEERAGELQRGNIDTTGARVLGEWILLLYRKRWTSWVFSRKSQKISATS
jgi:hypothetical protein